VASLTTEILAPDTTAPEGSVTSPERAPVAAVWADASAATRITTKASSKVERVGARIIRSSSHAFYLGMRAFATTPGVQVAKRLHHMMRVVNCKHHLLQFVLTRA
jgi:hypothetical protein